jgi:hypothetical protein
MEIRWLSPRIRKNCGGDSDELLLVGSNAQVMVVDPPR